MNLKQAWESFRILTIPAGASQSQITATETAFYAGAAVVLDIVKSLANNAREDAGEVLMGISHEIDDAAKKLIDDTSAPVTGHCPACTLPFKRMYRIDGSCPPTADKDIAVCGTCGAVGVFEDGTLRRASNEDLKHLDAAAAAQIRLMQQRATRRRPKTVRVQN
jgi:hypothetical protein